MAVKPPTVETTAMVGTAFSSDGSRFRKGVLGFSGLVLLLVAAHFFSGMSLTFGLVVNLIVIAGILFRILDH